MDTQFFFSGETAKDKCMYIDTWDKIKFDDCTTSERRHVCTTSGTIIFTRFLLLKTICQTKNEKNISIIILPITNEFQRFLQQNAKLDS